VRRHWVATGVAVTLALSLAAATIVSAQQARVARVESDRARQLNRFLENMLSSADPALSATRAGAITVREVLDRAGPLVPQTLGANPDVAAEMTRVIGVTYTGVGVSKDGEAYLRQAIAAFRELQDEIGAARASVSLGLSLVNQGRYPEAEQVLRAARGVVTARQAAFDARTRLASANLLALARSYQKTGDEEVLQLYRGALASPDADAEPVEAAVAAHNLGLQLVFVGRLDEAERWLRESTRRFELSPVDLASRHMVSRSMSELMRTVRNYPEAVRHGRAAVEGLEKTLPAGHAFHPPALTTLGRALVLNGDVDEGERVLTRALELFLQIRPKGHIELLGVQLGLGAAYRSRDRLEESEQVLREAQAVAAKATVQMRAGVLGELGLTLRARGRTEEARALLQQSLDVFSSYLQPSHPYIEMARARIAGATQ
jgi:tetratricopeptide (TPR) repeat protein